ncbi:MAG: phage BR0599 family protein [Caulobacteraceae bacterium]
MQDNRRLTVSGLDAFAAGWFYRGRIDFTGGANAGASAVVAAHEVGVSGVVLTLEERPAEPLAPGDAFAVRAGCDKAFATCQAKFANRVNFQGFPQIPGDDFLMAYPRSDGRNDGTSRNG